MDASPTVASARDGAELADAIRRGFAAEVAILDGLADGLWSAMRPTARLAVAVLGRVAESLVPGQLPAGQAPIPALRQAAVIRAGEAALNGWAATHGLGIGMIAGACASLRELGDCPPAISAPGGLTELGASTRAMAWRVAILDALMARLEPLERIRTGLELSETELGALFGVSRQAVSQWREKGIPANRADAVAHVLQTVDLLERKLVAGRLPLVARRPADRLGGKSILQALTDDPAGTHAVFAAAFDWSTGA